jgi:hypothetical protein
MKKAQKNFKFLRVSIPLILVFLLLPFFNLHYFLFQVFTSKLITIFLLPTWILVVLFPLKEEVFEFKIKRQTREKIFFYAIFITFVVFYFTFFSKNTPLIMAQTSAQCLTPSSCARYGMVYVNSDCSGTAYTPADCYGCALCASGRACFMTKIGTSYYFSVAGQCLSCSNSYGVYEKVDCNSWPSGNEGDECWVGWKNWLGGCDYRRGKWDPDDNACIIICNNGKESTTSDARDYCGSSGPGDGKCEQVCGASPECDEKDPGLYDANNDGTYDTACNSSCQANSCSWDSSDSKCVVCDGKKEKAYYDSGGNYISGDGKCELACGADPNCDEKKPGDACGNNGRCTSDCTCCEASDSDNGRDYLTGGRAQGIYCKGFYQTICISPDPSYGCYNYDDHCLNTTHLVEYWIYDRWVVWDYYDCSQRTDGRTKCYDEANMNGRCVECYTDSDCSQSTKGPKCLSSKVCGCESDSDCKNAGITCDAKGFSNRYAQCDTNTHTCTLCDACRIKDDCKDTYCCPREITGYVQATGDYNCTQKGRIINFQGKSYLCDPPNGFISEVQTKQKSLFEILFKFFNSWVQNFR